MSIRLQPFAFALLAFLLVACAKYSSQDAPEAEDGVSMRGGVTTLSGAALEHGGNSLLSVMEGKVPSMRVYHPTGQCPLISLRGETGIQQVTNPHVYVDATRVQDTCVLESLNPDNVSLVEVYPMGFTTRPGYGVHGDGLILVFLRTAR